MSTESPRPYRLICVNCGEQVERKDDGEFWHVSGYEGYVQCRLVATPIKELA